MMSDLRERLKISPNRMQVTFTLGRYTHKKGTLKKPPKPFYSRLNWSQIWKSRVSN